MSRDFMCQNPESVSNINACFSRGNQHFSGAEGRFTQGQGIDMATGFVLDRRTDFTLEGRLELAFKRFYHSSGLMMVGMLGTRWRTNWDVTLLLEGTQARFIDEQYSQALYLLPKEGERSFAAHLPQWCLMRCGQRLIMRHVDEREYHFAEPVGYRLLLSKISDGKGNHIHFVYEGGCLVKVLLANGQQILVDYHHRRIEKMTLVNRYLKPIHVLACYEYDSLGQMLHSRAGPGCSVDYQYNEQGYLLRWSDLSHSWAEYDYDELGRAIKSRGAAGRFCGQIRFDDAARVVYYKDAIGGISQYYRDERNNIICIVLPNGEELRNQWRHNQLITHTNGLGESRKISYTVWGQVAYMLAADGSKVQYEYDDFGRLLNFKNKHGACWQYEYNKVGKLTRVLAPNVLQDVQQWFYQYTVLGQLAWIITPQGEQTGYQYQHSGLLSGILLPCGEKLVFKYDNLGRVTSQTRHSAQLNITRWHYQTSWPSPHAVTDEEGDRCYYEYDIEGNITRYTDRLGQQWQYQYGTFNLLQQSVNPQGENTLYRYNGECQLEAVINHQQQVWCYQYNSNGQVVTELPYDGSTIEFTYDAAGRIKSQTAADGSSRYFYYNLAGQLIQSQSRDQDARVSSNTYFDLDAGDYNEFDCNESGSVRRYHCSQDSLLYKDQHLPIIHQMGESHVSLSVNEGIELGKRVINHYALMQKKLSLISQGKLAIESFYQAHEP